MRRSLATYWLCLLALCGAVGAQENAAVALEATAAAVEQAAKSYEDSAQPAEAVREAMEVAEDAFQNAQTALGQDEALRVHIPAFDRKGSSPEVPKSLRKAAAGFREAAQLLRDGKDKEARDAIYNKAAPAAEKGVNQDAYITDTYSVFAFLLSLLAVLFAMNRHPSTQKLFKYVPLLVFCYFVPTVFSNLGIIPISSPCYDLIKKQLLPASLVLLVLSVDIPAIMKLGKSALVLFFAATISIVIGGPLALLLCKGMIPEAMGDEAWKGLAALSGSWIGGGANFVAIGESVGASANTMSMMVVVDVALGELWTIALLLFAGREATMDRKIGADRTAIDDVRHKIEAFEKEVSKPTTLPDLLAMLAIAFGVAAIATALSKVLPPVGDIIKGFTWVVLIATSVAVVMSFTRLRNLEGAGASKMGSVFLYLLVAAIGAHAQFSKVFEVPALVLVGAIWMLFHILVLFALRRFTKAPIFFLAVGSKANVGGAASAPVVASAFHPSLAPVGVLLAVAGYVLGTYGGLACAALLEWVSGF